MEMAAKLAEEGHWVGICDHGQAHDQTQEMWQTAFTFLFDHVRGDDTRYGDSLPDGYPDYCVVQPAPEPTEEP